MVKTNPIGVRFDSELLEKVKEAGLAASPQKALNLYEKSFIELTELKVELNNKPESKVKTIADRTGSKEPTEQKNPLPISESTDKHPLWKEGDPKEGSGGFFMRYGVSTYDELEKSKIK